MIFSYVVTAPPVALYCMGIALAAGPALKVLYGPRYADQAPLVWLFAAYYFSIYGAQILVAAMNAERRTRSLFVANAVSAAIGLPIGWLLIEQFGGEGAVGAMILSGLVLFGALLALAEGRDPDETERRSQELSAGVHEC
jgi:O-antigen/teichoic acid export membrane protein